MQNSPQLKAHSLLYINQKLEMAEWIGFETRNKYQILDQQQRPLAYAAEQGHGIFQQIFRQFLGHWRSFNIVIFTLDRRVFLQVHHPFRWYFRRLEIKDNADALLGVVEKRFALLHKSFAVTDSSGRFLCEVSSPIWQPWTFPFQKRKRNVAIVRKKWSGLLNEGFTDKDKFTVEFSDPQLGELERRLILAAALFIDLQYFEKKAND